MLVYSKCGVHVTQIEPLKYVISADGYGEMLWVRLPPDNRIMVNDKYVEQLVNCDAIRTGKKQSSKK